MPPSFQFFFNKLQSSEKYLLLSFNLGLFDGIVMILLVIGVLGIKIAKLIFIKSYQVYPLEGSSHIHPTLRGEELYYISLRGKYLQHNFSLFIHKFCLLEW